MLRVTSLAALAFIAAAPLSTAAAVSRNKSVPAGRATMLDAYSGWNNDCSFLVIKVNITAPPAHGKISTRIGHGFIREANEGSVGSCLGKPTRVLQLWYTPKRGYHGSDTVSVLAGAGNPTTYYYSITVE